MPIDRKSKNGKWVDINVIGFGERARPGEGLKERGIEVVVPSAVDEEVEAVY